MAYDQYGNWVDEARENMLTAEYAAPGLRSMRNALQAETGRYYANPNVKRMTLRDALKGYGEGIGSILSGARQTAASQVGREGSTVESKRQFDLNYELQQEAKKQAGTSSMIGTAGNLATTGMLVNAMGGKPLLSNPFGAAAGAAAGGAAGQTATAAGIGYTGPIAGGGYTYGAGTAAAPTAAGTGLWGAAGGMGAAPAGIYAGPAAAGFVAPKILNALRKDSTEDLGHNLTFGLVRDEGTAKTVGGGLTGAGAGAGVGFLIGGPPGALVGAGVGAIGGLLGADCIIVTVCTDRHSPEVNIARKYRDRYLDEDQLRGYYALAEKIVPILERNAKIRSNVKKWLVNRLIDYGAYRLGANMARPRWSSVIISKIFLAAIKTIGMILPVYVRRNGEVY